MPPRSPSPSIPLPSNFLFFPAWYISNILIMFMSNVISPPSADKTNLAIADLVIYIFLLFPALWIARNHGKAGLVCWLVLLPYFPLRIVSDAYQVANRGKPELPNTVAIMTNAGSISCLSLALIGVVYEVNMWLPLPPKQWTEKILLGIMHLAVTVGIILAFNYDARLVVVSVSTATNSGDVGK